MDMIATTFDMAIFLWRSGVGPRASLQERPLPLSIANGDAYSVIAGFRPAVAAYREFVLWPWVCGREDMKAAVKHLADALDVLRRNRDTFTRAWSCAIQPLDFRF